jgi:hypothetical protein
MRCALRRLCRELGDDGTSDPRPKWRNLLPSLKSKPFFRERQSPRDRSSGNPFSFSAPAFRLVYRSGIEPMLGTCMVTVAKSDRWSAISFVRHSRWFPGLCRRDAEIGYCIEYVNDFCTNFLLGRQSMTRFYCAWGCFSKQPQRPAIREALREPPPQAKALHVEGLEAVIGAEALEPGESLRSPGTLAEC